MADDVNQVGGIRRFPRAMLAAMTVPRQALVNEKARGGLNAQQLTLIALFDVQAAVGNRAEMLNRFGLAPLVSGEAIMAGLRGGHPYIVEPAEEKKANPDATQRGRISSLRDTTASDLA